MEMSQRKKTIRTAILILAIALMTWVWFGLDLRKYEYRAEWKRSWSAATFGSIPPPDFATIWFPKDPTGIKVLSEGQLVEISRAIHVSAQEIREKNFHVLGDDVDVPMEEWTPLPPGEPQLSQFLEGYEAAWSEYGVVSQVQFSQPKGGLLRAVFSRTFDGRKYQFTYDIVKTRDGWNVSPVEYCKEIVSTSQPEGSNERSSRLPPVPASEVPGEPVYTARDKQIDSSMKSDQVFFLWCIRMGIRGGLTLILLVPILLILDSMEKKNIVVRWILRECLHCWLPKRFRSST